MKKKFDSVSPPLSEIAQREVDFMKAEYEQRKTMMEIYKKDIERCKKMVDHYTGCWFYYALSEL